MDLKNKVYVNPSCVLSPSITLSAPWLGKHLSILHLSKFLHGVAGCSSTPSRYPTGKIGRDPAFSFAQFVTLPKKYRNHESETLVIGRLSSLDGFIVSSGPKSWSHWPHMVTPFFPARDKETIENKPPVMAVAWMCFFSKTQPSREVSG